MSNDEEEVITHMKSYSLTSGSIPRHMLRLAVPLMLGNILQQLYNTVDAFILGRFAGDAEFAAVGVAGSVMNLFLFMITGACTGISVIFAQLYGAEDWAAFRREHWLSLTFGALLTVLCSLLSFLLLHPLLRLIQTPGELIGLVMAYLTVILLSLPAAFLYNLYSALLRAIGRVNAALAGTGRYCHRQPGAGLLLCGPALLGHFRCRMGYRSFSDDCGDRVHAVSAPQSPRADLS